MGKEFIPCDEKFIAPFLYYVLKERFLKHNNILVFVDDIIDFEKFKHSFLEIKKILPHIIKNLPEVTPIFVNLFQKKISYESIIDIVDFIISASSNKKFCFIVQNSAQEIEIPKEISIFEITKNKILDLESFISGIVKFGYQRKDYVETIGEFSLRGEILDIWFNGFLYKEESNVKENSFPVRIILEENLVKEIRQLDISSQRSILNQKISKLVFYPVNFDSFLEKIKLLDFLPKESFAIYFTENILENQNYEIFNRYRPTTKYYGNLEICKSDFRKFISLGYKIFVGYIYDYEYQKLKEVFSDIENLYFIKTELVDGFEDTEERILFISYSEIFTKYEYYHYYKEKIYHGIRLENIWEIQPQDYVVHSDFGIAKFLGIQKLTLGDKTSEFLVLNFQGDTKLYVPVVEFDKVEKYISLTNRPPKLSFLDSQSWQKTKDKIKESLKEFISQLYTIYTKRKQLEGISHPSDEELEKMLEESFEYEETEDQIKAIEDVKRDMCANYPMDRIIVGDVGFGKTEVAIRAAFKCVLGKRQVLVLCPTTVLAEQHYRTFTERLEPFGVKIGVITRLQPKSVIKETLKKLEEGDIDVVIGTHMLLNDNVKFFDLGLVIIDEEHKFGVKQKEKIRLKYRVNDLDIQTEKKMPDVLSLTATPIPRTLAFGLEGIKDISVIETSPEGRIPIETYVLAYSEDIVLSAINRELHRNGQVYYVFNDITLIQNKANRIKKYFPTANVEFIHSKLPAKKIEDVMMRFINKEIQILVTTTIIESGLDIPSVNTIIVENAERFGLAQLYQLRGRVGRRSTKAYCYFLYSLDNLTANAKKRLSALIEFSSLGSGYKLALRDLEIRGAGEVLGTKQHGFVNEVGLSMYSKIMQELISEVSSGLSYQQISPKIELEIEAFIPESYISDTETRIGFYKKFLHSETVKDVENIIEEMEDRFGKIKDKKQFILLKNFLILSYFRVFLKNNKIIKVYFNENKVFFEFLDDKSAKEKYSLLCKKISKEKMSLGDKIIAIEVETGRSIEEFLSDFLNKFLNINFSYLTSKM